MKAIGWMVRSSLAVLLVAMSTNLVQAVPPDDTCGQVVNTAGEAATSVSGCMDELFTAQSGMIDAVRDVVTEMRAMNLSSYGGKRFSQRLSAMEDDLEAKLQTLRDEHGRAEAGSKMVEEADYEDAFARADQEKRGEKCYLSDMPFKDSLLGDDPPGLKELDGKFGNDKCDVFKALVDIPNAPNDGDVIHVNERRENMCERVCADKKNPNDNKPRKEERKDRAVARLTEGIAATNRATQRIFEATASMSALRLRLASGEFRSPRTLDICVSGNDPSEGFEIAATAVSIANSVVAFGTIIAETVKDSGEPPANQSVAGFNVGSSVLPFAVIAGGFKIAEEILTAVEKGLMLTAEIMSANRGDTLEACLGSVRDNTVTLMDEFEGPDGAIFILREDVDDLQVKAGEAADALVEIQAELAIMKALLEGNRDLLLTPPGQRPGYNKR